MKNLSTLFKNFDFYCKYKPLEMILTTLEVSLDSILKHHFIPIQLSRLLIFVQQKVFNIKLVQGFYVGGMTRSKLLKNATS